MRDSTIDKMMRKEPELGDLPPVDDNIPVLTPNDGTAVTRITTSTVASRKKEYAQRVFNSVPGYVDRYKSRLNRRRRASFLQASEFQECKALIDWRDLNLYRIPKLSRLMHVPNGELRGKAAGGKLKAMGASPGFPDYCLWVARGGYHGLVFEMKRQDGAAPKGDQEDWLLALTEEGYYATACYGWIPARDLLEAYLAEQTLPALGRI
jgi:hypothetical protein